MSESVLGDTTESGSHRTSSASINISRSNPKSSQSAYSSKKIRYRPGAITTSLVLRSVWSEDQYLRIRIVPRWWSACRWDMKRNLSDWRVCRSDGPKCRKSWPRVPSPASRRTFPVGSVTRVELTIWYERKPVKYHMQRHVVSRLLPFLYFPGMADPVPSGTTNTSSSPTTVVPLVAFVLILTSSATFSLTLLTKATCSSRLLTVLLGLNGFNASLASNSGLGSRIKFVKGVAGMVLGGRPWTMPNVLFAGRGVNMLE